MQVILLERVESLGQMGDVVNVKAGYARNFLLPRNKALRATPANISHFDGQKKTLAAENLKKREEAEKVAKKADDITVAIIRQASEAGHLYGSVSARDIADAVTAKGVTINKNQVRMDQAYKILGLYPVKVSLHPEVSVTVTINIARSVEEARIQEEKGEALITKREDTGGEETPRQRALKALERAEKSEKTAAAPVEAAPDAEVKTEEAAA